MPSCASACLVDTLKTQYEKLKSMLCQHAECASAVKLTLISVLNKTSAMQLHELQLKALNNRAATPPPQATSSLQTPTTSNGTLQSSAVPALRHCQLGCCTLHEKLACLHAHINGTGALVQADVKQTHRDLFQQSLLECVMKSEWLTLPHIHEYACNNTHPHGYPTIFNSYGHENSAA